MAILVTMGNYYWWAVPVHAPRAAVDWLFVLCFFVVLGALLLRGLDRRPRPTGALAAVGGLVLTVMAWTLYQPACPLGASVRAVDPSPYAFSTWLVDVSVSMATVRGVGTPVLELGSGCGSQLVLPVLLSGYALVFLGTWYDAGVEDNRDADPPAQCHSTPK